MANPILTINGVGAADAELFAAVALISASPLRIYSAIPRAGSVTSILRCAGLETSPTDRMDVSAPKVMPIGNTPCDSLPSNA
ncbi:MAG: hypothetical protein SGI88_20040 [Candidatus Hydrogenedentes bacterium]|nr:hypothetical protein [Candidatus Hydrogenedentota bacterium]